MALRTRHLETGVAGRTRELVVARDELQRLATDDALTGIANRRKFGVVLDQEWRRARNTGHSLALALLDVDFFKRYNDRYGHARGDECLRAVAQAVADQCPGPRDLAARYGGEEFALVLPDSQPGQVASLLRAILAAMDALQIEHADSADAGIVTISIGAVSIRPGADDEGHAALDRADGLLYQAKANGRHQAVYADESGVVQAISADRG